jgi:antitoxin component of MazEF toxin-antitoxin module
MTEERKLIDVAHVSKRGSSLRISIPRKVAESIGISEGEILGFYSDGERIFVEKMR